MQQQLIESSNKLNNQLKILIQGDSLETKITNYILLIPLFLSTDCMLNNKKIMRKHSNSILDMKDAVNFHNFLRRN